METETLRQVIQTLQDKVSLNPYYLEEEPIPIDKLFCFESL